jgi:hypothetical protein
MVAVHSRDPGLQPERTVMAWQRTVLSFAAADLLVLRMLFPRFDACALAAAICSLTVLVVLSTSAARRQRRTLDNFAPADLHHRGHRAVRSLMPCGRTLAGFALASTGLSAVALLHVVLTTG